MQIQFAGIQDLLLFSAIHRFKRVTGGEVFAGFDLHKKQVFPILRNNIDFAGTTRPVALNDKNLIFFEVRDGKVFPLSTQFVFVRKLRQLFLRWLFRLSPSR